MGAQRTNGVYGALIIKETPVKNKTPPIDVIMSIGDWHHFSSEEVCGNINIAEKYGKINYNDQFRQNKTILQTK